MGEVTMRVKILYLAVVFLLQSCYVVHKQTASEFDYCYNSAKAGVEKYININGYYLIDYEFDDIDSLNKSTRTEVLVFLDDGIYIDAPTLDFFHNACVNEKWDSYGFGMGLYNIHNDTITVEYIYRGSATSGCVTVMYKIIDSNTLSRVFYGNCNNPPQSFISNHIVSNAKFIPYSLPDINKIWIKEMDWFWCDKIKFKEWKKQNK
jgi:hypothetical protein